MTACRNKARGAVVAALAGALTLGAAPVMALADGASLMALTPAESFAKGTLTGATNGKGGLVEINEDGVYTFTAGSGEYLVPTEITTYDDDVVPIDADGLNGDDNAKVTYYESNKSTVVDPSEGLANGKYFAKVVVDNYGGSSAECWVPFSIRGNLLSDAILIDDGDVEDTTFTYNTQDQRSTIGVALDGTVLEYGDTEDYTIAWKKVDSTGKAEPTATVTNAGSYIAVITGKGDYAGQSKSINFTVGKLDLKAAEISISDIQKNSGGVYTITDCLVNGDIKLGTSASTSGADVTKLSKLSIVINDDIVGNDTYTATVSALDGATNIEGSQTVEFNLVEELVDPSAFQYDGKAFGTLEVDLSEGEAYDADKITVTVDGEKLASSKFDVWYTDADGNEASESDLQNPGTYKVYVRVDAAANLYDLGSATQSFTVNVSGGEVDENDVQYRYDGKLTGDFSVLYDGTDVLDKLETVVKQGDKTLVAGEDYEVVVKKGGKKVDSIVDAGQYEVTLESSKYDDLDNAQNTLKVTVAKVKFAEVKVSDENGFSKTDGTWFLPYTGSVIETPKLVYSYYGTDGKLVVDEDGETVWKEMPEECWGVDYMKFKADGSEKKVNVKEVKEPGEYEIVTKQGDGVSNYDGSEVRANNAKLNTTFTVSKTRVFSDVANNEWYSQYVYDAASFGFINGYGNGTFFGPADSISRADVVKVLFNMAGQPGHVDVPEGGSTTDQTFDLPYTDCDEGAYYAEALQWATKLGIVSGDGSNGGQTFRPTDTVTREELAKILYNYMALQDKTEDVDADAVLGEYEDESSVSAWAREYVAWLVEQEVMGQDSGLRGDQPISRAEVATMAVRLQPNGQLKDEILNPKPATE